MKKLFFLFCFLLTPVLAYAQTVGYIVRDDCGTVTDAVAYSTFCLQSTTASGRTAGVAYVYDGASWIASTASAGSGHQIEDEGSGVTQRAVMNFVGAGVAVADTAGKTTVTVGAGAAASGVTFTPNGSIAATDVQAAIQEVRDEAQPLDADLTAVAALSTTGCLSRTAANTYTMRTVTGTSGNVTVTNGDCVSGNPTLDVGATVFQTDQSNTVTTGTQSLAAATALIVPSSAGSPTAAGSLNFNTSTAKPQMGNGTTTLVLASEAGNVATATALAANGANCSVTTGTFALGVDASGACEGAQVAISSATTPTPATVAFPAQVFKDTRTFQCGVQGYTYVGSAAAGDFAKIQAEADGYTTFSDGVNTVSPCGADTMGLRGGGNINFDAYQKSTADFANQPTNDGWEAVSDNAADTTQYLKVCGTLIGGDDKDLTCETIILNGTTFISSVTTTYSNLFTVRICTTSACVASTTAAGVVTLREASGNATIITLAAGVSKAAAQDMFLATVTSTLSITTLTQETTVSSTADKIPFYDASAGANRELRTTDIITTFEVQYKAVGCNETTGTLLLDTVDALKPTATCTAGTTNTTKMRGVAAFPDAAGVHSVQGEFRLPATWTGAIDLDVVWKTSLTSGNVAWKLQTICVAVGGTEADDAAWNTEQEFVSTADGTTNQLVTATQATVTVTTCAAGEKFRWRLGRDKDDAQDTLGAGTADLDSLRFTGRKKLGS